MKSKYIPLIALAAVVLTVTSLLLFDFGSVDVSFNFVKYHSCEADGKEFSFYGSFGSVGKLTVRENGKKLCSLDISADSDIYKSEISAVELCDINADGKSDILVAVSVDDDGDVHRAMFLSHGEKYKEVKGVDAVNFTEDGGKIISEQLKITYLAETLEEYTVPYEKAAIRTVYEYFEGEVIPRSEYRVSYYSESGIYCIGIWEYNESLEELMSVSEDWLSYEEYAREYPKLDEIFDVDLP